MSIRMRLALCAAVAVFVPATAGAAETPPSIEELQTGIEAKHPAAFYQLAAALLQAGKSDDAVFWFYAGQLRYRIYLGCLDEAKRKDEMALFGALSESVGRPINEYAFGDIDALAAMLTRALAWDAETPDGFTARHACPSVVTETRAGLEAMREQVIAQADDIRAQRTANGLPNR